MAWPTDREVVVHESRVHRPPLLDGQVAVVGSHAPLQPSLALQQQGAGQGGAQGSQVEVQLGGCWAVRSEAAQRNLCVD